MFKDSRWRAFEIGFLNSKLYKRLSSPPEDGETLQLFDMIQHAVLGQELRKLAWLWLQNIAGTISVLWGTAYIFIWELKTYFDSLIVGRERLVWLQRGIQNNLIFFSNRSNRFDKMWKMVDISVVHKTNLWQNYWVFMGLKFTGAWLQNLNQSLDCYTATLLKWKKKPNHNLLNGNYGHSYRCFSFPLLL